MNHHDPTAPIDGDLRHIDSSAIDALATEAWSALVSELVRHIRVPHPACSTYLLVTRIILPWQVGEA